MRKEIADFVLPVFRSAIEYKEGLRTNESKWKSRFAECQRKMLALLQFPIRDDLRGDFLGDAAGAMNAPFLGIRYAMACWIDEVFIDSTWTDEWNANKLETTLYTTNVRAEEFWVQAKRAQTRSTRDALEVYYLCVMLGFRGVLKNQPAQLGAWRDEIQAQIKGRRNTLPIGWPVDPDVNKPLKGEAKMQRWFMIVTIVVLAFIPLLIGWAK